jgi:hypothetical protein
MFVSFRSHAMRFSAFHAICLNFSRRLTFAKALLIALALSAGASAEKVDRPSSMKLFPEETVVFVRAANAHELGERFQQTSMGQMLNDPQMKPFVDHLYGKAGDLYAEHAEGKLGITWDDLKKLPKGEVAFAVVAREHRRPALALLIDQGDEVSVADKLVDKALDTAEKAGGEFSTEKIGDVTITVVRAPGQQNRMFGVFERDNTIVVATDPDVLKNVLWHWDHPGETTLSVVSDKPADSAATDKTDSKSAGDTKGKSEKKDDEFVPSRTLAENSRFATIIRECRRKQDPPPHLIFYADPVGLAKNVGRGNGGLQMALAMLPMLGLDGVAGLGGAATYSTNEYDGLAQFHLLLENPRAGILQLPAFETGDTTPQAFVPRDLESYSTWHLNLRTTYDRIIALVTRFGAKDAAEKFIKEKINDKLGIDILAQVVDNLKGRYTWMVGFDKPAALRGQQHVVAAELKDEKAGTDALKTVIGRFPEVFEVKHFGKVTYYSITTPRAKDKPEEELPYHPFVAITDGYLFVGTSVQIFERCVAAFEGTGDRLADSDNFKRASAVLGRETAGKTPVMFSTHNYEETIRQWYDLLTSPKTREQLNEKKAKNPILAALAETLEQNQLPPFDVLAPYFAPGGGILYDTDNGYHGISFTLRNETKQP